MNFILFSNERKRGKEKKRKRNKEKIPLKNINTCIVFVILTFLKRLTKNDKGKILNALPRIIIN